MDDPRRMRSRQSREELQREIRNGRPWQRPALQARAQRFSVEQLHHDERRVGEAYVVYRQNIGMREGGDRPRLMFEAADPIGIRHKGVRQHFDGDVPIEARVLRLIHLAHSARSNERDDFVRPEVDAWTEHHLAARL